MRHPSTAAIPATEPIWTAIVTASAANSGWRYFRAQRWPVQALVWLFALPVPMFLWALQHQSRRNPAVAFAVVVAVGCIGIPLAAATNAPHAQRAAVNLGVTDKTTAVLAASDSSTSIAPTASVEPPASSDSATPSTSTTSATTTSTQAASTVPPSMPQSEAAQLLSRVRVEEEAPHAGYDRGRFGQWIDVDGDGCDTRCEVLAEERYASLPGLSDGGWLSPFDGFTTDDPSTLDIDHLVPLAEAWRSGAWAWDPARRAAFANDLDDPRALIAVSAASNRSKSDSDPSGWRPTDHGYWCQYVTDWMAVKLRWDFSVDPIEFTALQHITTDSC